MSDETSSDRIVQEIQAPPRVIDRTHDRDANRISIAVIVAAAVMTLAVIWVLKRR